MQWTRWMAGACLVVLGCDPGDSDGDGEGFATGTSGAADGAMDDDGDASPEDPDPGPAPEEPKDDPQPDGPDGPGDDRPDDEPEDACETAYRICLETGTPETCAELLELCAGDDSSGSGDDLPPPSGDACCEAARTQCEEDGDETAATCAEIEAICASGTCEDLVTVCDPTTIPVSEACAEAYNRCYGFTFLVNKCERMSYAQCMTALDDVAICEAWDQSCADREAYCADLFGGGQSIDGGSHYTCTDWGHGFDRCYAEYEACTDSPSACSQQLDECSNAYIYTWEFECSGDGSHEPFPFPDDPDEPSDPGEPPG